MHIDIYIPTYNRKDYLQKAIESVLQQSYEQITLIISDDASSDGTEILCSEYVEKYKNIIYHRQETNLGLQKNAYQCLYVYGTGDFALFLSDDDELVDTDYIKKAVEYIKKYPDTTLIFSNVRNHYIDLGIYTDHVMHVPHRIDGKVFFEKYETEISRHLVWCNVLFHRDTAIREKCYMHDILSLDSDCFLHVMLSGYAGYIPTCGSIFRIHTKSMYIHASWSRYLENALYIDRAYETAKQSGYFSHETLIEWKHQMQVIYYKSIFDNLILFSHISIRETYTIAHILWGWSIASARYLIVRIFLLKIIAFLIRSRFFYKHFILYNNRRRTKK